MDYGLENDLLAKWMKNYAEKAGSKGFVVGLSGGIDSAVIACLAVKALGKENVIGVSIPCQSREDMNKDAKKLATNLDIELKTVQIRHSVGYLADALKVNSFDVGQLVLANIKARLRMTTLYAIAGSKNYLVAGTGNKSELMVGYFTKYGDGGVDMEPLGEYYKTEVYKMADQMPEIPNAIKVKAPTADLWSGQTDEQELGMTYAKLDKILDMCDPYTIYNEWYKDDGVTEEEFNKVRDMILRSVHKNEAPPRYKRDSIWNRK
jgi:NAD+ synthase